MPKEILFEQEAKDALKKGVDKVANAVGSTMGPSGRTVIINNHYSIPSYATKDGVSVADSVILADPVENIGAGMIRQAASKTYKDAGDGTTQTAVLAQAIIAAGLKQVAAGHRPQEIKRGIESAVEQVVKNLQAMSLDIGDDNEKIKGIATTSANNDKIIGDLIAEAYLKMGKEGLLDHELSSTLYSSVEVVEGYEMPRGYISPDFSTDTQKRAVHENAFVLVADYTIHTMQEIYPLLQELEKRGLVGHPLVIISQDYDGEFYSSMLINHRKGIIRNCLVKPPAAYRKEYLEDIATITGATVIRDEDGLKMQSVNVGHLGTAEKIVVSEYTTKVYGGGGKKEKIDDLKNGVRVQLEAIVDDALRAVWQKRLAKIDGKVAIIKVGGATELEQKERLDRVDDACRAVRAAIEEGVVEGGGQALLKCTDGFSDLVLNAVGDEVVGIDIVRSVCRVPVEKMLKNADISLDVLEHESGFNIKTRKHENLIQAGIIDPTKVIRCAIQNAASVACQVIGSDCLIVDVPAKN